MNVEELKEASTKNARAEGTFLIGKVESKPFKQKSGCFVSCELSDRTGTIRGVIWDNAEKHLEWLRNKMVVDVRGEATRYNDNPQMVITGLKQAEKFDKALLVPALDDEARERNLKFLRGVWSGIENQTFRGLWEHLIGEHGNETVHFLECPGGVGAVHHAYLGGLAEHVTGMVKAAQAFLNDPNIDWDLVFTGCLVHDIGKTRAYNWDRAIEMNDRGRLLHHVPLGCMALEELAFDLWKDRMDRPPIRQDLDRLLHIVVSHHQEGETGHRKPMFPEAIIVSTLDSLDAAVNFAMGFMKDPSNWEAESNWTRFAHLVERRFYREQKENTETKSEKAPPHRIEKKRRFGEGDDLDLDKILDDA